MSSRIHLKFGVPQRRRNAFDEAAVSIGPYATWLSHASASRRGRWHSVGVGVSESSGGRTRIGVELAGPPMPTQEKWITFNLSWGLGKPHSYEQMNNG